MMYSGTSTVVLVETGNGTYDVMSLILVLLDYAYMHQTLQATLSI